MAQPASHQGGAAADALPAIDVQLTDTVGSWDWDDGDVDIVDIMVCDAEGQTEESGYELCMEVKVPTAPSSASECSMADAPAQGGVAAAKRDRAGSGDGSNSCTGTALFVVTLLPSRNHPAFFARRGARLPCERGALVLRMAAPDGGSRVLAVACGPMSAKCGPETILPLAKLEDALHERGGARLVATVCVSVERGAGRGPDTGLDSSELFRTDTGAAAGGASAVSLRSMLDDTCFADVTLRAAGRAWRSHRVVLAGASPVFAAMLSGGAGGMREAAAAEVCMDDLTSPEPVDLLLRHIYGHDIAVPLMHVPALYSLAQRYMLRSGLAHQLLAHLLASRPSPSALAVLLPAAVEACPLACEASLFRQAAEMVGELSGEPAWLEGAQPAAVAGVMAHLPPDVALMLAGEWVTAGGEAEAGAGSDAHAGGMDVDGASGEGAPAMGATPGAPILPAPTLARACHWPALLGPLRWHHAGMDQLAKLAALLQVQGAGSPGAEGSWGLGPHVAGLQQALIARYQLQCERLALWDGEKQGALEGQREELEEVLERLHNAEAGAAAHKRSAVGWQAECETARARCEAQQQRADELNEQLDAERAAKAEATKCAAEAEAQLQEARAAQAAATKRAAAAEAAAIARRADAEAANQQLGFVRQEAAAAMALAAAAQQQQQQLQQQQQQQQQLQQQQQQPVVAQAAVEAQWQAAAALAAAAQQEHYAALARDEVARLRQQVSEMLRCIEKQRATIAQQRIANKNMRERMHRIDGQRQ